MQMHAMGGLTVKETVTESIKSASSQTMRWRASAVSGAADEYLSGLRLRTIGSCLPEAVAVGYSKV
jgi:hypothetical protein